MKLLLGIALFSSALLADIEVKGYVGLDSQAYLTVADGKHKNNFTAQSELELAYDIDDFETGLKLYAQSDYYDVTNEKNDRSFLRLDEAFVKYNLENDMIFVGKNIRFWGALEANNITDIFNPIDFRSDMLDNQKLGAWNIAWTHYTESGEISLIAKLYEQDQAMAAFPYVYYFFPPQLEYEKQLDTEKGRSYPTLYLKWSGSTDSDNAIDYAFILQHGYDSQKGFEATVHSGFSSVSLNEKAYLVNKFMTYDTMVVGSTLLKLEAQATQVINDVTTFSPTPNPVKIDDYYQFGLGFEHTLTGVNGDADLGLISEYYYYNTFAKSDEVATDLNLFQTFENDLFVGLRYTFNDLSDSSILAGAIVDLSYAEQSYSIEYDTRLFDLLTLKADYVYINPSKNTPTAYHLLGEHQRVGINLAYFF